MSPPIHSASSAARALDGAGGVAAAAHDLVAAHRVGAGTAVDAPALARDLLARAANDPGEARALAAEVKPRLSVVEQAQFERALAQPAPPQAGLNHAQQELLLDLGQIGLDVTGIFDPTPISDGLNTAASLARGDGWGALISAVSMVPYVGDLAKAGKLGHWAETTIKVAELAAKDSHFASAVRPALEALDTTLKAIPERALGALPKEARATIELMKRKVGEALAPIERNLVRKFDKAEDFNAAANHAAPDTRYEFGNYAYQTDSTGRIATSEGHIELNATGRNDTALQTQIGREGRETDIGFHIVADRFGGQTNRLNVVAGNGRRIGDGLPNLNQGAFKRFENTVAELARDPARKVEVRIEAKYNPSNASARPDEFVAAYRVDGGRWRTQTFLNK